MSGDLFSVLDGGATAALPFCVVELACVPRGKGDPDTRVVIPKHGRPFATVYKNPKDVAYERAIAWKAKATMRGRKLLVAGTPIAIRLFVMVPIAKSWPKRDRDAALVGTLFPTSRPDHDNYSKSVCDALSGIVWADDAQVCRSLIVKEYAEVPGIICEVFTLP
jgi:Holliday junction resolvase RusA-like endonuclease